MKIKLLFTLAVLTECFLMSASIVWAQPAPVAKTGQTISYATGDDGYHEKGAASPSPRFTNNGDWTVTDNLTGLMWAIDASRDNVKLTWSNAIAYANNLSLGLDGCGTNYTDWRLPNLNELNSLLDKRNFNPAMPTGHPFLNVKSSYYWSSTTDASNTDLAWYVYMQYGDASINDKGGSNYIWPVRGGN
jgi:hypothetical protein